MRRTVNRLMAAAIAVGLAPWWAAPAFAKDKITFAAAVFAEAGRGDRVKAWIESYNQSQTGVEVEPIAIPFSSLANTVFTQMGGGGGPDLIRLDQTDFFAAIPSGRLLPLGDVINDKDYPFLGPDRFMKVKDVRYGLLFDTTGYALLYNKDILPQPPKDFESFLAAAREKTRDGTFGYAYRATMAERAGFWQDLCNYVFGFGGRWSDKDGNLTLNSPDVIKGVAAYKKVYDAGVTPKGADAATYRRMFWEGKIAMNVDNGGVAAIFNRNAPQLPFAAAPSPFPDKAQGLIMTALVVNANTKHKDAAGAFIKWAYAPENQKTLQAAMGTSVGTRLDMSPEEQAKQPWLRVYEEQMQNALPQLVMGHEDKTPEIQQIVLEQVLKVLLENADPKDAMDRAQSLVERRVLR
ncbi:sugar ABC transporter [Rhizobium rhizosphaerae]|uniref:Sugar ABC transporter n=1 Tax=Xaviernesmea rhizosphaerae TaxID=1672749 RepID=A0A1Q9ALP8_9HYPH|nr:sugar ABC transporter substrate-binding protein [Xaviernesmea rhizosphaerae]OLP56269.1 sugar ABC transporter [Xaviernesmea rhizosphaerae]